jgi:predicted nucleic acid-binding protein
VATTTYLDASAIVKILLREADAGPARELWRSASRRSTSVVAFVEARAAIAAARRDGRLTVALALDRRAELDWRWEELEPVGLDDEILTLAGSVADDEGLRALDAIHLATALYVADARTLFVTWDRRLAGAASRLGLAVAPASVL